MTLSLFYSINFWLFKNFNALCNEPQHHITFSASQAFSVLESMQKSAVLPFRAPIAPMDRNEMQSRACNVSKNCHGDDHQRPESYLEIVLKGRLKVL